MSLRLTYLASYGDWQRLEFFNVPPGELRVRQRRQVLQGLVPLVVLRVFLAVRWCRHCAVWSGIVTVIVPLSSCSSPREREPMARGVAMAMQSIGRPRFAPRGDGPQLSVLVQECFVIFDGTR